MPIPVTCPECQFHFLVGEEFAGQPGRCPECAAIIDVPGSEPSLRPMPPDVHLDPYPYRTPRAVEAYEDFPSRRRRREPEHRDPQRDDYDDRPRGPRPRRHDPQVRAAAWARVYKGLGSVQIAVILYFFGQALQTGFFLAHGMDRGNANALPGSGEIAVGLGGLVIVLAAGVFWILGRLAGTRVPYIPARGWARAGFYMGLTGVFAMVAFFCGFITAFAMIVQQGPNGAAVGMMGLSFLAGCLGAFLLFAGEVCSLVSLAKIGDGLHAASAGSWARMSIVFLLSMLALMFVGSCGLFVYAAEKQKQKAPQGPVPGVRNKAWNPPAKENAPVPAKEKADAKDMDEAKDNDAPADGQAQQQPIQPDEGAVDEKTMLVVQFAFIGLFLLYLLQFSVSLQKGRRAIREEIHRLVGSPENEHDRY